ncbi:MAG: hypothetical protein QOE70_700 [Chthoniobacter sp.]|jgi:glycosyltransferase involved in cell wall biosynthesis|nr:hypothetical protein [Chthoniobacter sp.]
MTAAFFSVVPSPYQRDLFAALARRTELDLRVYYLEAEAPDSPWPARPLAAYEQVLPGTWLALGSARCHVNRLPDLRDCDMVVLNTLMSFTAQWLMRVTLRRRPWVFWGERLNRGGRLHALLSAPLHRAAGIASIGSFAEGDYRERFHEPRHRCIPYYCELAPFLETVRHRPSADEITFLFCGQMIARKGVDLLLEAFRRLDSRARLLLVGREGELPPLLAALPPEARARITYAGFQPPEELPRFFAQADVFVLPSRYDGWGVVVNQALGAGLPIVCSDLVGAGHDLVEPEVNGLRFRAGDVDTLMAALSRLMAEPELLAPWGEASRRKAAEMLPDQGAERWVRLLEEVTAA